MPLRSDVQQPGISALVGQQNIAGQPGGGPLAPLTDIPHEEGKRFSTFKSEVADAAGRAVVNLGAPPLGFSWLVERITVRGGGTAQVYVGKEEDSGFRDYSNNATFDVADENSPIYTPGGQDFLVVFAAAGAGTVCKVTIQVRVTREGNS